MVQNSSSSELEGSFPSSHEPLASCSLAHFGSVSAIAALSLALFGEGNRFYIRRGLAADQKVQGDPMPGVVIDVS